MRTTNLHLPANHKKLLDEFGQLDAKLAAMEKHRTRREQLRKQILEWVEELPARKAIDLEGDTFCIAVSAKRPERTIVSMPGVFAALGGKKFVELASVSVKALEQALPASAFARLLKEEPIGRRTVTASLRAKVKKVA